MALALPSMAVAALLSMITDDAFAAPAVSASAGEVRSSDRTMAVESASARLRVFTPEVQRWSGHILNWSRTYALTPELIAVVMQIESCGHPTVQSNAGALGLFQVMPFHFRTNEDPLDPEVNARRGLSYLAQALQLAAGETDAALAGYNGGHGVIGLPRRSWPDETQRYVHWGQGILEDIQAGERTSATLQAWLDAGGSALCRRAALQPLPIMD